jgi:serine/threonine protein kinase
VSDLIDAVGPEGSLDARQILLEHPSLCRSKSVVLDLAYEEYCRRVDAGEEVDVPGFVRRFPGYQTSLLRQIEAHEWLAEHPEVLGAPVTWPIEGAEFLGFRLREELGRGAFSRVFLAEELALGQRAVVVKVSRLSGIEPRALGRLRHPHIVPVHSVQFDEPSGLSAICMPFYGRATLYDLLDHAFRQGTAPSHGRVVPEAIRGAAASGDPAEDAPRKDVGNWWATSYAGAVVRLGTQLSDALEFAHRAGIFHCDIKPSNVLLCLSGVRLFDFNLALGEEAASGRGGTLPYMAPEQLQMVAGKAAGPDLAARVDARTDLFSLGVLLYELLSGQLPWGALPTHLPGQRVAEELLARHARGPRPLRAVAPTLNARLAQVIESCLAYRPADRPATAAQFGRALRREMGWRSRGARFSREHRRATIVALAAVLVAATAGGAYWATLEPAPVRHLRLGQEALHSGDYARAVEHFDAILATQADDHQVRFLKVRAHLRAGQFDEAEVALRALLDVLPEHPYVLAGFGYCLAAKATERSDFAKAFRILKRIPAPVNATATCLNNLAYCQLEFGQAEQAVLVLQRAAQANTESSAIHRNLAEAYYEAAAIAGPGQRNQHLQQAQAHIARAVELAPIAKHHLRWVIIYAAAQRQGAIAEKSPSRTKADVLLHCREAVRLGEPKQHVIQAAIGIVDPREDEEFSALADHPARTTPSPSAARLLDPLWDLDALPVDSHLAQ